MFGLGKSRRIAELERKVRNLEEDAQNAKLGLSHLDQRAVVQEMLSELLKKISSKDLLDRILLAQGLSFDTLVKEAVRDCLREYGLPPKIIANLSEALKETSGKNLDYEKIAPSIAREVSAELLEDGDLADKVAELVLENLGEEFDSEVANRVSKALLNENESFAEGIVEKVVDLVYASLEDDELYPAIGEKVVAALQNHKS